VDGIEVEHARGAIIPVMSPAEGLRMAFELFEAAVKLYRAGLRHDDPGITGIGPGARADRGEIA
jgi:hypothetical protein